MIKFVGKKTESTRRDISTAYFEFDGRFFPCEDWTDFDKFVVIWSKNLSESGSADMIDFIDGPYGFEVEKQKYNYVFRFYTKFEDSIEQTDEYKCSRTDYLAFMESLKNFSEYLMSIN
jgi:hypothetical protein